MSTRLVGHVLAALGLLLVVSLTLTTAFASAGPTAAPASAIDALLNVGLFVPLGMGCRLAGQARSRATAACLVVSLLVEGLQLTMIPGRHAAPLDVIANAIGGAVGVGLVDVVPSMLRADARRSRTLWGAWAVVWLALVAFLARGLQPVEPAAVVWGQWAHRFSDMAAFEGRVTDVRLNGLELSEGPLAGVRPAPGGALALEAVVRPGAPTPGLAPIVTVAWGAEGEALLLGQAGRAVVFRYRARLHDSRPRGPAVRLALADGEIAGDAGTFRVRGDVGGGTMRLRVDDGTMRRAVVVPLRPFAAWVLALPRPITDARLITAGALLLLALSLVPLGYWTVAARAGVASTVVALAMLAVAYASAMLAVGAGPPAAADGLAAAGGIMGGALGARWRWLPPPGP